MYCVHGDGTPSSCSRLQSALASSFQAVAKAPKPACRGCFGQHAAGPKFPFVFCLSTESEIQPRVRQQAVTFVNTCARRTGRSYAKRRDGETLTQLSRHGDNSPVRQEVLQRSRAATRSINILALVSYIQVLILRTCDHLSFHIGTPRSHRSLPWALHLPRAAHAAAKLPTLF